MWFELYHRMPLEGTLPSMVHFSNLAACSSMEVLSEGKMIHVHALFSDYKEDTMMGLPL